MRPGSIAVVVPIKGRSNLIATSLASLRAATESYPESLLVLVDNNPADEVDPAIYAHADHALIVRSPANTVAGVRNDGVAAVPPDVEFLAFIDSDCVVGKNFCSHAVDGFRSTLAAIVGCKVISPEDGHWTERASDELHRLAGDGVRAHLNSGCMCIRAEVFREIGGFKRTLTANEDYDLCDRVRSSGRVIWQLESLRTIHLGNPKSILGYFRRMRWHGQGAVDENGKLVLSPMAVFVISNALCWALALVAFVLLVRRGVAEALLIFIIFVGAMPAAFWLARMVTFRRWIDPLTAIPLMGVTFPARLLGIIDRQRQFRQSKARDR